MISTICNPADFFPSFVDVRGHSRGGAVWKTKDGWLGWLGGRKLGPFGDREKAVAAVFEAAHKRRSG